MCLLNNTFDVQDKNIDLNKYSCFYNIADLKEKAKSLSKFRILHINATKQGGGVAAILRRLVPALNKLSILNHWYVPENIPSNFFEVTKKQHNMLQGVEKSDLSDKEKQLYLKVQEKVAEKIDKNIKNYDVIILHDTQFLGLVDFLNPSAQYIYRCHVDTSEINPYIKSFFQNFVKKVQLAIYHTPDFVAFDIPYIIMPPSTDPFEPKNQIDAVTADDIKKAVERFGLSNKRPLLLQVGRFDPAKGFDRVIRIYKEVKKFFPLVQVLCTGAGASDDPEFEKFIKNIKALVENDNEAVVEEIPFNPLLLNAIQQAGTIVFAMSTKEGFGLVASEAAIKEKPLIVSNVGGLKMQVINGKSGFIVNSDEEAIEKTKYLLNHPEIAKKMGKEGRKHILKNFILPNHLENYLTAIAKVLNI